MPEKEKPTGSAVEPTFAPCPYCTIPIEQNMAFAEREHYLMDQLALKIASIAHRAVEIHADQVSSNIAQLYNRSRTLLLGSRVEFYLHNLLMGSRNEKDGPFVGLRQVDEGERTNTLRGQADNPTQ
jgi:hypothetical protein